MNEGFDEGRVSDRRRRGSQEPGTQRFVPAVARMAWAEVMKNPPTPPKPPHDGMTGRRGHFTREVYKEDGPGRVVCFTGRISLETGSQRKRRTGGGGTVGGATRYGLKKTFVGRIGREFPCLPVSFVPVQLAVLYSFIKAAKMYSFMFIPWCSCS